MSSSQAEQFRDRTKQFAIRVVRLFRSLPKTEEAKIIGKQALRSGTSVAANYRAVCRARSKAEFVARIGIVVEEADETVFWLELLIETGIVSQARMDGLLIEANELLAIFATLQRTAKTPMVRKKNESMTQFPLPNDSMKNEAMTQFLHPFLYNPASFAH